MDETITERAFLRERFLKFLSSNNKGKACDIQMLENTAVKSKLKAFDPNFEHVLVENLTTPCPPIIPSAILRTSDILCIEIENSTITT